MNSVLSLILLGLNPLAVVGRCVLLLFGRPFITCCGVPFVFVPYLCYKQCFSYF